MYLQNDWNYNLFIQISNVYILIILYLSNFKLKKKPACILYIWIIISIKQNINLDSISIPLLGKIHSKQGFS